MSTEIRTTQPYIVNEQVGFLLRRASQRHLAIFAGKIDTLTATQFAVLAKLSELGSLSQNALGRMTAMDAATIKGVVDRLARRGLLQTARDPSDKRRMIVHLTNAAIALYPLVEPIARDISDTTLAPLSPDEQITFLRLLKKLC